MIRVLYDYQAFIQKIGGVSRVHMEIIRWLTPEVKAILPTLLSDNIYLDEIKYPRYVPLASWKSPVRQKIYKQMNQWRSIWELKKSNYDIFHVTGLNPYFISHVKKPVLSTMHDLTFEKYPTLLPKSSLVIEKRKKILSVSDHVVCVSLQTKKDLIDIHHYPENKISVVYSGTNGRMIICTDQPLYDFPYVLFIGGRNGYKNFTTFAKAFSQLNKDFHLVCTGLPFEREEMELFKNLKISDRVHQRFVSDSEMDNLICNATLFVYPSLSEGFGLPLLDSFRGLCPCVVSDILCFHEVADDAALYFNPLDIEDMVDKMTKVIDDSDLRKQMITKGKERVPLFTWKKCSQETEAVYYSMI